MTTLGSVVALLLQAALLAAAAPLLTGLIRWAEGLAAWPGGQYRGVSPAQPYRELRRLCRKQAVMPESASALFVAAPVAGFAAVATASLLVPTFTLGLATAPLSDLLVIAGLLSAARAAAALGAMDAGSASGGLGAGRAGVVAAVAEPGLLLVVFVFAASAGTTNLDAAAWLLQENGLGLRAPFGLVLAAASMLGLADNGRMVRAGLSLEYSGRLLAIVAFTAMLKRLTWLSLIAALFAPFGMAPAGSDPLAWAVGLAAWAMKVLVLAAALAAFEASAAALPWVRAPGVVKPGLLGLAVLLAVLAAVFLFASQGFA